MDHERCYSCFRKHICHSPLWSEGEIIPSYHINTMGIGKVFWVGQRSDWLTDPWETWIVLTLCHGEEASQVQLKAYLRQWNPSPVPLSVIVAAYILGNYQVKQRNLCYLCPQFGDLHLSGIFLPSSRPQSSALIRCLSETKKKNFLVSSSSICFRCCFNSVFYILPSLLSHLTQHMHRHTHSLFSHSFYTLFTLTHF